MDIYTGEAVWDERGILLEELGLARGLHSTVRRRLCAPRGCGVGYSRQMTRLERRCVENFYSSLIQVADVNAAASSQPEPSRARPGPGCSVNGPSK